MNKLDYHSLYTGFIAGVLQTMNFYGSVKTQKDGLQ